MKECVIAHWSSDRARIIYRGSSLEPKLRIAQIYLGGGRGALPVQRSQSVRTGGALGSENAGMSSVRNVSKRSHRMAEVSAARFILGGLVGPKPRPKGVGDGQTVDIPLPLADDSVPGVCGVSYAERSVGVAASNCAGCLALARPPRQGEARQGQFGSRSPPRKARVGMPRAPVPQTDTGGRA